MIRHEPREPFGLTQANPGPVGQRIPPGAIRWPEGVEYDGSVTVYVGEYDGRLQDAPVRVDIAYDAAMDKLPRALWWLIAGVVLNSLGFAFLWPLTAIYLHQVLAEPMPIVGTVLMVQSVAGLAGSVWGGSLYDRYGARGPLLVSAVVTAALFATLLMDHTFDVYALATSGASLAVGVVFPCLYALAAHLWPQGGRRAFNAIYVAQNVGVAFGSILGGLVATLGFRWTFLAAAVLVGTFAVIIFWVYRGPDWETKPTGVRTASAPRVRGGLGIATLMLAGGLALDWLAYVQWQTTAPNFMQAEGFSLPLYSLLWTVNGGLVLLGQPFISWVTRRVPSVKRQILLGNAAFLTAYLGLAAVHQYVAWMGAMGLATLGEMMVWPGVPAAADQLAPPGRRGLYQGVIAGAGAIGRAVGPLAGGLLFAASAPGRLYLAMAGVYVLAIMVFILHDRPAWTEQVPLPPAPRA